MFHPGDRVRIAARSASTSRKRPLSTPLVSSRHGIESEFAGGDVDSAGVGLGITLGVSN